MRGFGDSGRLAVADASEAETDGDQAGVGEEGEGVVGVAEVLVGGGGGWGERGGHVFGEVKVGVDVAAVDGFRHDGGLFDLKLGSENARKCRTEISDGSCADLCTDMTMRGGAGVRGWRLGHGEVQAVVDG